MDGQLTAVMLVGVAVGVKILGSVIARRRGHRAEERWESFMDKSRKLILRTCLTFGAGLFWGFLITFGLKYLALNLLAVTMSEEQALLYIGLPVLILITTLLWPKTSKLVA